MKNPKKIGRRCLSLLLSFVLCLGMLPGTALAADHDVEEVLNLPCPNKNKENHAQDCTVNPDQLSWVPATCQNRGYYFVTWSCGESASVY